MAQKKFFLGQKNFWSKKIFGQKKNFIFKKS